MPVEGGDSEGVEEFQQDLDRAFTRSMLNAACRHDIAKLNDLFEGLAPKKARVLLSVPDRGGQTALYLAYRAREIYWHPVSERALQTMKLLLSKGADPNQPYRMGYNLHVVFDNNRSPTIQALGLVDEPSIGIPGFTLLEAAANDGSLPAVKLLVEHGADVNARTNSGGTPLISALFWDFRLSSPLRAAKVIDYLLQRGAQLPPDYRLSKAGREKAAEIIEQLNQMANAHPNDADSASERARVVAFLEPLLRRSATA